MKTTPTFRLLSALVLALSISLNGFGQTPKKLYSTVYYHKIKPGHTFAEARAMENDRVAGAIQKNSPIPGRPGINQRLVYAGTGYDV
ncbi:hypothetical protein [Spirosoma rhododendri]|uniref:Uncharacterized protein n=1 Tax=Spirosoma rhododendri TaxID=2728024 RepID=A0A7L5DVK0_9BACT|nr:hypothetical protein [Spirosoma rhododendri]QJD80628.1 hypothetical protein HH216_21070 [Spirosoma rhododendri]